MWCKRKMTYRRRTQFGNAFLWSSFVAICGIEMLGLRANGCDVLYLPGDAFFHSFVDLSAGNSEWRTPESAVAYTLPTIGQRSFGESVGAERLQINDVEEELLARIRETVHVIRNGSPSRLGENSVEENPIHLFIYSKDFDPSRWKPFIKFNREWVQIAKRLVPSAKVRAGRFVPDLSGDEDRFADPVPRLKSEFVSTRVVSAKSNEVRWLLVNDEALRAHVRFEMGEVPEDSIVFYDLVPGKSRIWERASGKFKERTGGTP
jgi:hypothetical protein